jgi:hypothetical protein
LQRARPLKNPRLPPEARQFEGEFALFVRCAWRLEGPQGLLTSSTASVPAGATTDGKIDALVGSSVEAVTLVPSSQDLAFTFRGSLRLLLFCDRAPGDTSENYVVYEPSRSVSVEADGHVEVAPGSRG